MQKIALAILLLLLLGQSASWGQSVFTHRLILKTSSVTDRLNPCYYPVTIEGVNNGTVTFTQNGSFKYDIKYVPDSGFIGLDTLIMKYEDNLTGGKIIYKSFVYETVNSYLDLRNDFITVFKGQLNIEIKPLSNDSSSIGSPNAMSIKNLPVYHNVQSNLSILSDSIIKFSTPPGFEGAASITYRVCDTFGLCKEANINISIIDTNTIKINDTIEVYTPEDVGIQLLLPYSGFTIDNNANHGNLSVVDASFIYKSYKDYNGKDTFVLKKDNLTRWVFVQVIAQAEENTIIVPDVVFTPVNKEITFDVSLNDLQPVVYDYAIGIDKHPNKGTLTKLNNQGLFKYIPQASYAGVQTFTYKVCPQGVCEYVKVRIYIGNYEPVTEEAYEISTYKNVPILLSYQIPITAYNFNASSDSIKYFPGWDTIDVSYNNSCTAQLIGYNQLVYYPYKNSIGTYNYTIDYCIAGTNDCEQAELNITILNESKNCTKQCVGDCVWPGDVDLNGQVDMRDLLSLGYELGKTGPVRSFTGNTYRSHEASNWGECMENSSIDIKNADCNGDSTINSIDTVAIFDSYGKTHSLVPNEIYSKGDFPIYFNVLDTTLGPGDLGMIEVQLGDDLYKAMNVSGYSYILDYNEDAIYDSTLYVNYLEQDWFGRSATLLNMFKKPFDGRLESGFVRANGAKVSGKGPTEVLVFIVEDDIAPFSKEEIIQLIPLQFSNIIYQGENGEKFQLDDQTIYLKKYKKDSPDKPVVLEDKKLIVYPNPATDYTMIHLNGRNTISSYELYSVDGRIIVENNSPNPKQNVLSTAGLSNGIYVLKVTTPVGLITRKIEIMN
ncbi:MAG: T9SS type A sorting domain-containing protein [Saprospiraceae bacterium]|nr:T9SS type A sorting domain-containing protein [Saprospiraceae bacterium]